MSERPERVGTQIESIVNNAQSIAARLRAEVMVRQMTDQMRVDHPGPTTPNLLRTGDLNSVKE